jgi:hypothetical protein
MVLTAHLLWPQFIKNVGGQSMAAGHLYEIDLRSGFLAGKISALIGPIL